MHGGDHDPGTATGLAPAIRDWLHSGGHNPAGARDLVTAVKAGISATAAGHLHAVHWAPETDPFAPFGEGFTTSTPRTPTVPWPPPSRATTATDP